MKLIKDVLSWIVAIAIIADLIMWGVVGFMAPMALFKVICGVLF